MPRRLPLLAIALAATALGGCGSRMNTRAPVQEEPQAGTVDDQGSELARVTAELERARRMLAERKGGTIGDEATGIAGTSDIEGLEQLAGGGVALPDDFAFAKGSATLNEAGERTITRLAAKLNDEANAGLGVLVVGHTDASPVSRAVTKERFGDNWGLSAARAAAVLRALEKAGVKSLRLTGGFRGEHQPRVPSTGKKDEDQPANRRVEIFLGR